MTSQLEKELTFLVKQLFQQHTHNHAAALKDFCVQHFSAQLLQLKKKIATSNTAYYEKEILLVNDEVEVMMSAWLPGNTCYPHDHDQAACFVFVLSGVVENTLLDFTNDELKVISKTTKVAGDDLYLANGIIHYMQNIGTGDLLCLHVYTPGISEMKVFDEQQKKIYTLSGEAAAWLPANNNHILQVKSYGKKVNQPA